jgi:hypothetical protein
MGKIGEKTGGRKPGTPNKVTQSIRILLNTVLPPEELEKHWRFYLKHRDIEMRFAAFKLAQPYMFGRPSSEPLNEEDAPQHQGPQFDLSQIVTRHVPYTGQ